MVSEGFQWFQMVSERFDFSNFLRSFFLAFRCHRSMEKSKKVEKSKRSETIWNHWKPSETIGNPSETFGKPQKPSETFGSLRKPSKKGWKNEVLGRNGLNFGLRSSRPDRVNPLDRGTSKIKVLAIFSLKIEGKLDFSLGLASAGRAKRKQLPRTPTFDSYFAYYILTLSCLLSSLDWFWFSAVTCHGRRALRH